MIYFHHRVEETRRRRVNIKIELPDLLFFVFLPPTLFQDPVGGTVSPVASVSVLSRWNLKRYSYSKRFYIGNDRTRNPFHATLLHFRRFSRAALLVVCGIGKTPMLLQPVPIVHNIQLRAIVNG